MKRWPHLRWLVLVILLALPTAIYWNTIFHHYGFRDDYSILRESREEPGKVWLVCAMQARPLYGAMMEPAFARLRGIADLQWLRLLSAFLLGGVALALFGVLRAARWDRATAALVAAFLTVLPGAQMIVSWTVAWPLSVALLFALAAFACAERSFAGPQCRPRVGWWIAAVLLVMASALTYQPNSLFYFVGVAAALWPRRRWVTRSLVEWFVRHLATMGIGLAAAFTMMMTAFARGWVPASNRVALEHDWLGKLDWFISAPLQNALATIVLNDDNGSRDAHRAAMLLLVLLIAGVVREGQTRGWRHGVRWLIALVVLVLASFSVNLLVADRWPAYRVLLPLTGVLVVFMAVSLVALGGRMVARFTLAALVLAGAWLAHRQAFDLIAWPQSVELALLAQGAAQISPAERPRVFVITPTPFHRLTERSYRDEFGSLSTDSDWAPKEMLQLLMHERYPQAPDVTARYTFDCGRKPPPASRFDVVIDLRRLREFRGGEEISPRGAAALQDAGQPRGP